MAPSRSLLRYYGAIMGRARPIMAPYMAPLGPNGAIYGAIRARDGAIAGFNESCILSRDSASAPALRAGFTIPSHTTALVPCVNSTACFHHHKREAFSSSAIFIEDKDQEQKDSLLSLTEFFRTIDCFLVLFESVSLLASYSSGLGRTTSSTPLLTSFPPTTTSSWEDIAITTTAKAYSRMM